MGENISVGKNKIPRVSFSECTLNMKPPVFWQQSIE